MGFLDQFEDPPERVSPGMARAEQRVSEILQATLEADRCHGCGRESSACSHDPCRAVLEDRGESVKPLRDIDGPHPDAIEPEAAADYSPEERQRYRDLYARAGGAVAGSPNYEHRAQEFDRRAIAAVGLGAYADRNPVPISSLIPPRPTAQGEVGSSSTSQPPTPPAGDSKSDPARVATSPVTASPPETAVITPRRPNGKRPYQRVGTAQLSEIATVGGLASALGEDVPDRAGVVSELAWRHKPAAFRLAAVLGCDAGVRTYPGSARAG